jgi:hypothetical protein
MKRSRKEESPFSIIYEYASKYPRHTAFRGELRKSAADAKLDGMSL